MFTFSIYSLYEKVRYFDRITQFYFLGMLERKQASFNIKSFGIIKGS